VPAPDPKPDTPDTPDTPTPDPAPEPPAPAPEPAPEPASEPPTEPLAPSPELTHLVGACNPPQTPKCGASGHPKKECLAALQGGLPSAATLRA
jgi:hypothetical protein